MTRMKTWISKKKRQRLFMTGTSKEEPSMSMKRFDYITLALSFFQVSCAHDGTVLTWLWNCLKTDMYLFFYPKSGKQFKINGHYLKPYLTAEPPTPRDKVNLHLPEVHEDMTPVTPSSHQLS